MTPLERRPLQGSTAENSCRKCIIIDRPNPKSIQLLSEIVTYQRDFPAEPAQNVANLDAGGQAGDVVDYLQGVVLRNIVGRSLASSEGERQGKHMRNCSPSAEGQTITASQHDIAFHFDSEHLTIISVGDVSAFPMTVMSPSPEI